MRRRNVQHGQDRRRPLSPAVLPSVLLIALTGLLIWELSWAIPLLS